MNEHKIYHTNSIDTQRKESLPRNYNDIVGAIFEAQNFISEFKADYIDEMVKSEELRTSMVEQFPKFLEAMNPESSVEEILAYKPDVLIPLDGEIAARRLYQKLAETQPEIIKGIHNQMGETQGKRFSNIRLTPTSFIEGDISGYVTGAKIRFIAAAEIYDAFNKNYPNDHLLVIPNAGSIKGSLIHALIGADYLHTLGVERKDMIPETHSQNTFENIRETVLIAHKNNKEKLAVLTSAYHLPRTEAFYETLRNPALYDERCQYFDESFTRSLSKRDLTKEDFFKILQGMQMRYFAAEPIACERDQRYRGLVAGFYRTPAFLKRLASELKGYTQLLQGTYGKRIG